MKKLKQAFSVAGYNFRQWHRNPRIGITFALAFILCFLLSDKVVLFARRYGTTIQLLEPFIWTFGDSDSILLASLLLVFLLSDMPFLSVGTPFYLMRTSRCVWLLGQAIYIVGAASLYLLFVMFSTAFVCMENAYVENLWSPTAAMLGFSNAGKAIAVPAAQKAMETVTPYACAGTILLLMLLYSLLLAFIMLLFHLWKGQAAGLTSVFAFSLFGFLLSPDAIKTILKLSEQETYIANQIVGWLSPLNHATFHMHNFGYDNLPEMRDTIAIFILLIFLCFGISLKLVRTYGFIFTGTEGSA